MNTKLLKLANDTGEGILFRRKKEKDYLLIGGAGKDCAGDYRYSSYRKTIKECFKYIGCFGQFIVVNNRGIYPEYLENLEYVSSHVLAYGERLPLYINVRILENSEEECIKYNINWNKEKKEMVGKIFEIKNYDGSDYRINGFIFPRTAFTVYVEEETKEVEEVENEITITADMVGQKIKIVK